MIPTYTAYVLREDNQPTARIKIKAISIDSATRKAMKYFRVDNAIELKIEKYGNS